MRETEFDIILTDLNLPDISGIEMVRRCKEISPQTEIIMVTGFGSNGKGDRGDKGRGVSLCRKAGRIRRADVA